MTITCLTCGTDKANGRGKYCSVVCQKAYEWEHITKPLIEVGHCTGPRPIKKYLIETRGNTCSCCQIPAEWNGLPLTLQIDHVDGNSDNNLPDNLRLLCPNCHTQTETYGAKGSGNTKKKDTKRNSYLREYKLA